MCGEGVSKCFGGFFEKHDTQISIQKSLDASNIFEQEKKTTVIDKSSAKNIFQGHFPMKTLREKKKEKNDCSRGWDVPPLGAPHGAEEANRLLYPQALKEIRRVTRASGRGLVSQAEIETTIRMMDDDLVGGLVAIFYFPIYWE